MRRKELGVAVIGSGRIGSLRARLAARHPAVNFLAVSDIDAARSRALAELAGADFHSTNNDEVIARPEVNAVIVSTPEHEHVAPVCKALELGKPVLMEKPLGLTLRDADAILDAVEKTKGRLRIGYIRRFKRCFARAKEQVLQGHLGRVTGGTARVYNTRAQAFEILKRNPEAYLSGQPHWARSRGRVETVDGTGRSAVLRRR
jgi:predicted dehydrogenase